MAVNSIKFPDIFKNQAVTDTVSGHEATQQNLNMLLHSEQGELFGDPEFGTRLKYYLQDPNDDVLADIIIDSIYTAIATFMPQIKVRRSDIIITQQSIGKLVVYIPCTDVESFQTDMYSLVLLQNEF